MSGPAFMIKYRTVGQQPANFQPTIAMIEAELIRKHGFDERPQKKMLYMEPEPNNQFQYRLNLLHKEAHNGIAESFLDLLVKAQYITTNDRDSLVKKIYAHPSNVKAKAKADPKPKSFQESNKEWLTENKAQLEALRLTEVDFKALEAAENVGQLEGIHFAIKEGNYSRSGNVFVQNDTVVFPAYFAAAANWGAAAVKEPDTEFGKTHAAWVKDNEAKLDGIGFTRADLDEIKKFTSAADVIAWKQNIESGWTYRNVSSAVAYLPWLSEYFSAAAKQGIQKTPPLRW